MKNYLLSFSMILLILSFSVNAQITITPGDSTITIQAQQCAYLSDGLIGECFDCAHDCDLAQNKVQARVAVESFDVGRRLITSTTYSEFSVSSTPETEGNNVTASLSYDVEWKGWLTYTTAILDYNPSIKVYIWIKDLTRDQLLENRTIHEINSANIEGSVDIVDIGVGRDIGQESGELNLTLIRGHSYRIHLSLSISLTSYSIGVMKLDYLRLGEGAWWNELNLKVFPDLDERLSKLEERVDSLEEENKRLRFDLENHSHTYLTGKGTGHNNVIAETSPAIFLDTQLVYEDSLDWLTEDNVQNEQLPVKTVLLSNFPNPFNPTTTIQYNLPIAGKTSISLYNVLGQKVKTILDDYRDAGTHQIEFNGSDLSSGVYYYRLTVGNFSETRKLTLIK